MSLANCSPSIRTILLLRNWVFRQVWQQHLRYGLRPLSHGLDPHGFAAQSGFMKHELLGREARSLAEVRRARTVEEAAIAFERSNERAGVAAMGSRERRARAIYDTLTIPFSSMYVRSTYNARIIMHWTSV
jgi:hypothetical protein